MLSVIGELPITTLEGPLHADALLAKKTLDDVRIEFQNTGWFFNSDDNFELVPDENGQINVAAGVVNIDIDPRDSLDVDVVLRGKSLYDRKNHTYVFTRPIKAKIINILDFDSMPQSAKNYVIAWASMKFQNKVLGVADLHSTLSQEFLRAQAAFKAEDIRNSDRNMLSTYTNSTAGFYSVLNMLRRRL